MRVCESRRSLLTKALAPLVSPARTHAVFHRVTGAGLAVCGTAQIGGAETEAEQRCGRLQPEAGRAEGAEGQEPRALEGRPESPARGAGKIQGTEHRNRAAEKEPGRGLLVSEKTRSARWTALRFLQVCKGV